MPLMQQAECPLILPQDEPLNQFAIRHVGQGLHLAGLAGVMNSWTGIMMFASGVPGFTTSAAFMSGPAAMPIDSSVRYGY
jgi:hypothetical protein